MVLTIVQAAKTSIIRRYNYGVSFQTSGNKIDEIIAGRHGDPAHRIPERNRGSLVTGIVDKLFLVKYSIVVLA
jgi:hypothetical protein